MKKSRDDFSILRNENISEIKKIKKEKELKKLNAYIEVS